MFLKFIQKIRKMLSYFKHKNVNTIKRKECNNNVISSNHPYKNTYILIFNTSAEYFMTKMNFNWKIITDAVGKVEILHSGPEKN